MYKAGDVLLKEGDDVFSLLTKIGNFLTRSSGTKNSSRYTHTALFVNDHTIIEALSGGVKMHAAPYEDKFVIYRKEKLTNNQILKIRSTALQMVGIKYSYLLATLIGILKFFRLEKFINGTRYEGIICSVVVGKAYKSIEYSFKADESVDFLDPGDIAEHVMSSDQWKKVVE